MSWLRTCSHCISLRSCYCQTDWWRCKGQPGHFVSGNFLDYFSGKFFSWYFFWVMLKYFWIPQLFLPGYSGWKVQFPWHLWPGWGMRSIFHFKFHLPSDGGHPVLVAQQSVHVHTVLDHQGRDWNERKNLKQQALYCWQLEVLKMLHYWQLKVLKMDK